MDAKAMRSRNGTTTHIVAVARVSNSSVMRPSDAGLTSIGENARAVANAADALCANHIRHPVAPGPTLAHKCIPGTATKQTSHPAWINLSTILFSVSFARRPIYMNHRLKSDPPFNAAARLAEQPRPRNLLS